MSLAPDRPVPTIHEQTRRRSADGRRRERRGRPYPGWYYNLTASPTARVEVDDHTVVVWAQELEDEETDVWWRRILETVPDYDRYRRATTRPFPIIRLTPDG